jgi:hypothetical protein
MKDILVSLFLVSSVVAGASETAGVTNFMQGGNPLQDVVRSLTSADAQLASVAPARAAQAMQVAFTDGTGVRPRTACVADAPDAGAITEGTSVQVIRVGGAECPGWALVSAGGVESWVRMTYLKTGNAGTQQVASAGGAAAKGAVAKRAPVTQSSSQGSQGDVQIVPTAFAGEGLVKGLGNGQGWGQGVGGGKNHQTSGQLPPGNATDAGAASASNGGNAQGWGQGAGGGQDHLSSGQPAPGNSDQAAHAKGGNGQPK